MKKIVCLILSILLIGSVNAMAFENFDKDVTYYPQTNRCVVKGSLSKSDKSNKDVSLALYDGEDNVVFADSTDIDFWGNYEFRFDYEGDMQNLKMNLRSDGQVVNDAVKSAVSSAEAYNVKLEYKDMSEKDKTAVVSFDNKYGITDGYTVVLSFYDANKRLIGTKTISDNKLEPAKTYASFNVILPVGTVTAKAFVFNSLEKLMPIADSKVANGVTVEKGERIAYIGASDTAGVGSDYAWAAYTEYLLKLRYPDYDIQIENRGISGDAPNDTSEKKLAWDSFALTSQFGSNEAFQQACTAKGYDYKNLTPDQAKELSLACDSETVSKYAYGETLSLLAGKTANHVFINWGTNAINYSKRATEEIFTDEAKTAADNCYAKYKHHLKTVLSNDSVDKVTILPIPTTKQGGEFRPGTRYTIAYYNSLLKGLVEQINETGKFVTSEGEYTVPEGKQVFWADGTERLNEVIDADVNNSSLIMADGAHPNYISHIVYTTGAVSDLGVSPTVAEVDIEGDKATAYNADITNLSVTVDGISYTYAPKAYPVAKNDMTDKAKSFFDIDKIMNNEIIKATGLSKDNYTLYLNGEVAGIYTKEQLAEGINIACLEKNPNQKASNELFELYKTISDRYKNIRRIYANIAGMNGTVDISLQDGIKLLNNEIAGRPVSNKFNYYDYVTDIYNARQSAKTYTGPMSYLVELK